MKKRIVSALIALLLCSLQFAALPAFALVKAAPRYDTPSGYNDNDFQKLVAFMENADENGVKNGEKIVAFFNGYYIPTYPESWSYYYYDHEEGALYQWGVFWTDDETDKRVCALNLYEMDLVGALDFSECIEMSEVYCDRNRITALNASGCPQMRTLLCADCGIKQLNIKGCTELELFDCSHNGLSVLDASDCPNMFDIECNDNALETLDLTGCAHLGWLDCFNNRLTELDLSSCPELYCLNCTGNPLKELDLSHNTELTFDRISAEGRGTVSFNGWSYGDETAYAEPADGAEFLGWYSDEGELISSSLSLGKSAGFTSVTARFTPIQPGDVDSSGAVDALDALIALRYTLGLIGDIDLSAADVDSSGSVNALDALLILRASLGLAAL